MYVINMDPFRIAGHNCCAWWESLENGKSGKNNRAILGSRSDWWLLCGWWIQRWLQWSRLRLMQRSQTRRWAQFLCSMRKGSHSDNIFIVCFGGWIHRRANEYLCLEIWLIVVLWLVDAALIKMVQVATQRSQVRRWAQFPCSMRKGPLNNNIFIVCFGGQHNKRVNEYPCWEIWLMVALWLVDAALITMVQVAT